MQPREAKTPRSGRILIFVFLACVGVLLLTQILYGGARLLPGMGNVQASLPAAARATTTYAPAAVGGQSTRAVETPPSPLPTPQLGRLQAKYPQTMKVDESTLIVLQVSDIPQLASESAFAQPPNPALNIDPESDKLLNAAAEDRVRLFPIMSAELSPPNFEVSKSDQDPKRLLANLDSASWTWNLLARKPGSHEFTINVFGFDANGNTVGLVMSLTRRIEVMDKPWNERLADWLSTNLFVVIGSGGPIGLIIAYLAYRATQNEQRRKKSDASSAYRTNTRDKTKISHNWLIPS